MHNDGGPAFPGTRTLHVTHDNGSQETGFVEMRGMTLRDYFAAKLQPIIYEQAIRENWAKESDQWRMQVAYESYRQADEAIIARGIDQ